MSVVPAHLCIDFWGLLGGETWDVFLPLSVRSELLLFISRRVKLYVWGHTMDVGPSPSGHETGGEGVEAKKSGALPLSL